MVAGGLLAAIRARVAARGMTFTALARASGVQPGNLRRMLTSTTASPRLGSVMRLIPPLHGRIAPAGARTAAELAAFLEAQRQRTALSWDQLLGPIGPHADKIVARLAADPEQLSLDVVMHLADALHVELALVDDDEAPMRDAGERPPKQRSRPARRGPASPPKPDRPATPASPPEPASPPASSSSPTPTPPSTTFGLAPLRPPRLGRYRDMPPEPPRAPRPSTAWTPTKKAHALEHDVVAQLASLPGEAWSSGFAVVWSMLHNSAALPVRLIENLGTWTASALQRFRRSPATQQSPPEPPDGCFDELDPGPLVRAWVTARQPDYRPPDTLLAYDAHGVKVGHIGLDGETLAVTRLAAKGCPHRLIAVVHLPRQGAPKHCLDVEVPLAIKIGGEAHNFVHLRAGPVFGEILIRERAYLLVVVSSLLAIVEVHANGARVVWGGRAERLSAVDLAMPPEASPESTAQVDAATSTADLIELAARLEAETRRRTEVEAELAAERSACEDVRRALQTAMQEQVVATRALESAQHALTTLQSQFKFQTQAQQGVEQVLLQAKTMAGQLIMALSNKTQACEEATEQRQAAEARAAEAEQARDALLVERAGLRQQLHDRVDTTAAQLDARAQLDAERQRRSNAESLAAARDLEVDALKAEVAELRQTAQPTTLHREPAEPDRLAEVQKELDDLRQAQADDAAHMRELIEADRFSEVLRFFVARILGVPVKDDDHAFELLEQQQQQQRAPETHKPTPPLPEVESPLTHDLPAPDTGNAADPATGTRGRSKIGRNDPCPCGSGKKFKRCCWLSSS